MHVCTRTLWLQKEGNRQEEYEDAAWPMHTVNRHAAGFRCAVADGATEASFSQIWARMLVRAWCRGELSDRRLSDSLARLRQEWLLQVRAGPLPWYAEEKLRSGAFSSLVGIAIREDRPGSRLWQAVAIGDSCLFQVRGDRLLAAFPLTRSEHFTSRPFLLSSVSETDRSLSEGIGRVSGSWMPGDTFFLLTDALASWFLQATERGQRPWCTLRRVRGFHDWIAHLRQRHLLRNDDVTMLCLDLT